MILLCRSLTLAIAALSLPRFNPLTRIILFLVQFIFFALPLAHASERVVLFLGDSLTAGFGVEADEAYPALVDKMLKDDGIDDVRVVNGGLSGSTSASAQRRLRWYARVRPDVLFLAMGANDGLRGLTVTEMEKNLEAVIVAAKAQGMSLILAGMELPPNYGEEYIGAFRKVYAALAERHQALLIPFLLEGVGGVTALNQADGIHPNAEGHRRIAMLVYPYLKKHLQTVPGKP